MADYYVQYGIGNDTNSGTSRGAGNSWATFQKALNAAVAGETVQLEGTEVLSAVPDLDTNNGTVGGGWIKFIGADTDGTVDGTTFKLDCATNSVATGLSIAASYGGFCWFENIEIYGATSDGVIFGSNVAAPRKWINCHSHDNSNSGWEMLYSNTYGPWADEFIRCSACENGTWGWESVYRGGIFVFCSGVDNTLGAVSSTGPAAASSCIFLGGIYHSNGAMGIDSNGASFVIFGCTINDHTTAVDISMYGIVLCSRLTNVTTAIAETGTAYRGTWGYNYYEGSNSGTVDAISEGADADTNNTGGTEGYNAVGSSDFNLTASATDRNHSITIPIVT